MVHIIGTYYLSIQRYYYYLPKNISYYLSSLIYLSKSKSDTAYVIIAFCLTNEDNNKDLYFYVKRLIT